MAAPWQVMPFGMNSKFFSSSNISARETSQSSPLIQSAIGGIYSQKRDAEEIANSNVLMQNIFNQIGRRLKDKFNKI